MAWVNGVNVDPRGGSKSETVRWRRKSDVACVVYGKMYGMKRKKTTIYLPDTLKHDIERASRHKGVPEAQIIRDALSDAMEKPEYPAPKIPLVAYGLGAPDIAERAEELLGEGFGR
jgi:hypothetical protein